jgi:hypothetical protein
MNKQVVFSGHEYQRLGRGPAVLFQNNTFSTREYHPPGSGQAAPTRQLHHPVHMIIRERFRLYHIAICDAILMICYAIVKSASQMLRSNLRSIICNIYA